MNIYVVRRGDTLWNLARRFGTTVEKLAFDNQLADPSRLPAGLALIVRDAPGAAPQSGVIECNGYAYPNIAGAVLEEYMPFLTFLCPFSWQADAEGGLTPIADQEPVVSAYSGGTAPLLTITNIGRSGGFSGAIAHSLFTDPAAGERFTANMLSALRGRKYYGVNLDFEYVFPFDRDNYSAFIEKLAGILHPLGYYFVTTVAPKESDGQPGLLYEAVDYAAHGRTADRVIIMTYEWGYTYSPPRAVSPVNKVLDVLDYAVTRIPPGKILMGLSNYGYSWALPWKQGSAARVISNAGAADLAASVYAEIRFDAAAQAPYFRYTDPDGIQREVWFEDPRSFAARLRLVSEYALAGASFWTINRLYRPALLVLQSMYGVEKIL